MCFDTFDILRQIAVDLHLDGAEILPAKVQRS
jgi:hypothetical protein